ncbi:hypothetical protein V9T40_004987 [Parthenolecanium corni]|uniref:Uncharacterized protein n=1 Tax=Parthenolecanium corni TaxID=536013 RepID=A0AAN9TH16_9HEMI
MMFITTSTLILFVLNGISYSSSLSLFEDKLSGSEKINPLQQPNSEVKAKWFWFQQKLDHFDENNKNTWKQKYYEEEKYYEKGGPVYLLLENKHLLRSEMMSSGYWQSHGKENKAMLFYMPHRYHDFYTPLKSARSKDLIYLNTKQALEDFAAFIRAKNDEHEFPEGTKWIVFGSSFAGYLAAWLRAKYPDLVYGAVASSAPVLAQMDCPEYLNNVDNTLTKFNRKCQNDIAQANVDLDKLVESSDGRKEIGEIFQLCEPLDSHRYNVTLFATTVTNYISEAIQNDFKQKKLDQICKNMMKDAATKKPIQRYSEVISVLMKEKKKNKCLQTNFYTYSNNLRVTFSITAFYRGKFWLYQQCNELGWFLTSPKKSNTFSKNIELDYSLNLCSEIFGSSIDKKHIDGAVAKTNQLYGGLKLNTPRTLFVNGDSDPWRFAQITTNKVNKNVDVITIKGRILQSADEEIVLTGYMDDFQGKSVQQMPFLGPRLGTSENFVQIVDHFSPSDTRTWRQWYYKEESYYKKGGPVYLFISDRSDVDLSLVKGNYWFLHAQGQHAMIFILEHRFFSRSQPFTNTVTRNLQYLHSAQAVADAASFITEMNDKYTFPTSTKWIVIGGSHGGNLAAWLRLKYPHLVYGAVASSAMVHAQLELPEYLVTVSRILGDFKSQCKDDIEKANEKLDELSTTISGRLEIGRTFK